MVCSHQSDRLGYVSRTNQSVVFVLWFKRCSHSNEVMGDSERAVRKLELSFKIKKSWLFCVFKVHFTALYEERDITGQMKDLRLPIVNVLLTLWKWWSPGVLCTVARSWLLFLSDETEWKIFFVARFMICWVCRLYFSGLVCSVLSLDECLIKINYGRFYVCFRWLEKVIL